MTSSYQINVLIVEDEQLAYDLVHDAVEKLISKTLVFNKMAYAKKIIRNKFYDILKSKSYTTSVCLTEEIVDVKSVDQLIGNNIDVAEVLSKLKANEREMLYLWAVEEYTTREISSLTGVPKGTITSRLKRLRDRLQNEFGGNDG